MKHFFETFYVATALNRKWDQFVKSLESIIMDYIGIKSIRLIIQFYWNITDYNS